MRGCGGGEKRTRVQTNRNNNSNKIIRVQKRNEQIILHRYIVRHARM